MEQMMIPELIAFLIGLLLGWLWFGRKSPRAAPVAITSAACISGTKTVRVKGEISLDPGTVLIRVWAMVYDDPMTVAGAIPPAGAQMFPAPAGNPANFDVVVLCAPGNTGQDRVVVWSEWQKSNRPPLRPTHGYNRSDKNFAACP